MSPPRPEIFRRAARWFLSTAALALAPKCVVCVAAYFGLGAALGLGGPEICGASAGPAVPWATLLAASGVILSVIGLVTRFKCVQARAELETKTPPIEPA